MTTQPAVVVVGDLVSDTVAQLVEPLTIGSDARASVRTTGGGSGANVAAWLAASGVAVTFVARVGADAAGTARVQELRRLNVDVVVAIDPTAPTGTVIVIVTPDGERTMLPDRGANANLAPADLADELFAAGRHLHLSGYTLFEPTCRAAGLHALQRARDAGMTTSVDPASAAPLRSVGTVSFLDWTAGVDLCLPNLPEAAVLTGTDVPEAAAARLAQHYGQVVLTLGGQGALWTDGAQVERCPAAAVNLVDTTGAGDAFTAGYLRVSLGGGTPQQSLREGNQLAARAVGGRGGRPFPPPQPPSATIPP